MSEQTGTAGVGILEPQAGAARFGPGRAVVLPGGTAVERAAVVNPAWLGIGQAIDFARAAALFPCRILVARGRQVADAKHALDLAALGAAAGPAANILLVIIFSLALRFGLAGNFLNPPAAGLLGLIVLINLALAIFNLLPVPPLDGSKILVSFLPYSARQAEEFFYRYQFILFFVLLFIILNTSFLDRLIYFLFNFLTGQ